MSCHETAGCRLAGSTLKWSELELSSKCPCLQETSQSARWASASEMLASPVCGESFSAKSYKSYKIKIENNKKLLVTKGIATRSKNATSSSWPY